MEKITVLLPEAEVERHIIDICSDSTKFDVGRGLAPFDKIHVLPGPPRKTIFLRQAQENSKPIGYVHILPVRNNSIVKFVSEAPNADFCEFTKLVMGYFQDLNLLVEPLFVPTADLPGQDDRDEKTPRIIYDGLLVQKRMGKYLPKTTTPEEFTHIAEELNSGKFDNLPALPNPAASLQRQVLAVVNLQEITRKRNNQELANMIAQALLDKKQSEQVGQAEELPHPTRSQDIRIAKRREKVKELSEKGEPVENIARNQRVSVATVVRDREFLGIATKREKSQS